MSENLTSFGEEVEDDESMPEEGIELEDGSVVLQDPDYAQPVMQQAFDDNLALILSDSKLNSIASELCDLIEKDMNSREERDKQYEEGIRRTGLGNDAPGGASFEGASKVVHPVLAEACVDYASATIKEVFPPEGPVKIHFLSAGNNPDILEKAENKRDFLNWQLSQQIVEYKTELEVLLTQQPLGGSQYIKWWYDESKRRIRCEFVPIDKLYLPFAASSFLVSQRFTIVDSITEYELKRRIASGLYREIDGISISSFPEESSAQIASDKVEGKEQNDDNVDGLRDIYEVHAFYEVEDQGPLPYIITIDKDTEKVLSIYRNWEETDPLQNRLEWVVEYPFIPWRGAYGIGLLHLIGSLSIAATGALRALLDSALINNFPGAVRLKGGKSSGHNLSVGPNEVAELDAPANVDDIRKTIMPMPFNPPSGVLFQLLGWLTEAAKGVVSTAEEKISDATNQMPVGTALALIEQGSKVFSAIHARQHLSQQRSLAIVQRLNAKYYDEQIQLITFGKVLVTQQEFANIGNIVPVSDPNIFSESQRFAQVQSILQMAQDQSVQWNKFAIYKRILRLMHVEAPQEFLTEPPQPVSADPVTEIVAAMSGQQIAAQPQMDHMWHIQEQLSYLLDPIFGAPNKSLNSPGFQVILTDIFQHLLFQYQQLKTQTTQQATSTVQSMLAQQVMMSGVVDPQQMQMIMQQQMQNPAIQQQIKQQANIMYNQAKQQLAPVVQALNMASEMLKEKAKKLQDEMPLDPQSKTALKITEITEQNKLQISQIKTEFEKEKESLRTQLEQSKLELDALVETQIKPMMEQLKGQVEVEKNTQDNIAKSKVDIEKNTQDNETNVLINTERNEAGLQQAIVIESMRQEQKQAIEEMKLFNQQSMEEMKAHNNQLQEVIKQTLSSILTPKEKKSGKTSE